MEIPYLIFYVVFFALLMIGAQIFGKTLFSNSSTQDEGVLKQIWNGLTSLTTDLVSQIPGIGKFLALGVQTTEFTNVHPYISIVISALIGIPLIYIIVKVYRGGG